MKEKILNEIVNNTFKLIGYKTIKDNYNEFDKALEFISKELKDYYVEEYIVNNYKNIVISNTKEKDLDVIFCCHVDVVPALKYEGVLDEGKLYGRGSFDMKGQLSVVMSLFKNNKSNKKIALMITSDEEIGGMCCKEILKGYNAKLAVVPDGGKNFELVVEEKGLLQVELTAHGVTAHASEPYKGNNPILMLISLYESLLEIYKMPKDEKEFITSVNLSKLNGGDANNKVPDFATMNLDVRFTKKDNIDNFLNYIKNFSPDITLKVLDHEPVFYVDEKIPVIKEFIKNCKEILGRKPVITKCCAGSDAPYFSEKNIPVIMMNPNGKNWHGDNEYVEIDSLYTLYEIFKTLL